MSDIVLLYSQMDHTLAGRLLDDLDEAEFDVWTDEEFTAGSAEWKQAVRSAIKDSECVIVMLSPGAAKSNHIEEAVGIARLNHTMIFPILIDGELRQSTPAGLRVDQFTDLRGSYEDGIGELLGLLEDYFERWDEDETFEDEELDDDYYGEDEEFVDEDDEFYGDFDDDLDGDFDDDDSDDSDDDDDF